MDEKELNDLYKKLNKLIDIDEKECKHLNKKIEHSKKKYEYNLNKTYKNSNEENNKDDLNDDNIIMRKFKELKNTFLKKDDNNHSHKRKDFDEVDFMESFIEKQFINFLGNNHSSEKDFDFENIMNEFNKLLKDDNHRPKHHKNCKHHRHHKHDKNEEIKKEEPNSLPLTAKEDKKEIKEMEKIEQKNDLIEKNQKDIEVELKKIVNDLKKDDNDDNKKNKKKKNHKHKKENKDKVLSSSSDEDDDAPYTKFKRNIRMDYRPTTQMNYSRGVYNEKQIEKEVNAVLGNIF